MKMDTLEIITNFCTLRSEGWSLAKDKRELIELKNQYALLKKWGKKTKWITQQELSNLFPANCFYGGHSFPQEGCIEPNILCKALLDDIAQKSISLHCPIKIFKIEDNEGYSRIRHNKGITDCEIIIFMQHDNLATFEPFFCTTLGTIRTQSIAYKRRSPAMKQAFTSQYGYISWRDCGDSRILSGCRWATPHLEIGEKDDSITIPAIEDALIETAKKCFREENINPTHRWSFIEQKSCDGLPLVGAIPGRAQNISCTAFQGRLLGLGFAAAEAVVQLLVTGEALLLPSLFSPRRFRS